MWLWMWCVWSAGGRDEARSWGKTERLGQRQSHAYSDILATAVSAAAQDPAGPGRTGWTPEDYLISSVSLDSLRIDFAARLTATSWTRRQIGQLAMQEPRVWRHSSLIAS